MQKILLFFICVLITLPAYALEECVELNVVEKREQQRANFFIPYDTDMNGSLDAFEIQQGIVTDFTGMDLDGDHVVAPEEQKKALDRFKAMYARIYSVRIDKMARALGHRFSIVDKSQDDVISFQEYQAYFLDRYQRMDGNKDGVVSLKEFRPVSEKVTP